MAKSNFLTAARLRDVLNYDPMTGIFTWRVSMGSMAAGKVAGKLGNQGYIQIGVDGKLHSGHRLAWLYMTGNWPEHGIDHKNTIRHDNQWSNLRAATVGENNQNIRKASKRNRHGLLGITKHYSGKWQAQIQINRKNKYLGLFDTPESAHLAYLEAKYRLHPFQTISSIT